MSKNDTDTRPVCVEIEWQETVEAMKSFLVVNKLPKGVTDKQLVDLQVLVGNARARLLEKKL